MSCSSPNIPCQPLQLVFIDDYLETLHEAINDSVHILLVAKLITLWGNTGNTEPEVFCVGK